MHDLLIQAVLGEPQRHFVDGEFLVHLLDDRLGFDVAKECDFLAVFATQRPLGADDQDVGLDTDLPQLADAVLRRLGLGLAGRLQIRHQREVHEQAILLADVERNLPDGFQEGQPLDVAHRAAELGDHDVDARLVEVEDGCFDFVGDVRDHLDRAAQIFAATLFFDDAQIDLARRVVRLAREGAIGEPLVVPQVEIGLGAVVEHVDFAVLIGAHRARIDVDVRIELLHPHIQATTLEQEADRGGREPFAQTAHDAAGHEDVLGLSHALPPGV